MNPGDVLHGTYNGVGEIWVSHRRGDPPGTFSTTFQATGAAAIEVR